MSRPVSPCLLKFSNNVGYLAKVFLLRSPKNNPMASQQVPIVWPHPHEADQASLSFSLTHQRL
eukprot:m.183339 g.183339  ORF g.183339 m.183339 type:complete len:63 (-) comp15542_c0_seq8:1463-1651(-)